MWFATRLANDRHELCRTALAGVTALTIGLGSAAAAIAQDATPMGASSLQPGSMTAARPFIIANDPAAYEITPILTTGEIVGDYQFAGNPDGIGVYQEANGDVIAFVNHEWSSGEPGSDDGNISASRVSRLVLDGATGAVKIRRVCARRFRGLLEPLLWHPLRT